MKLIFVPHLERYDFCNYNWSLYFDLSIKLIFSCFKIPVVYYYTIIFTK